MEKKLQLTNGDKIIMQSKLHYCVDTISITKGYFENGELRKTIAFNMWDDFSFEGLLLANFENPNRNHHIDFCFEKTDPLYVHLDTLLGTHPTLVIDDDNTGQENKKYMQIIRKDTNIQIQFVNALENASSDHKFSVFVKNIFRDHRSKIDHHGYDTKERLIDFFDGIRQEFLLREIEEDMER